MNTKERKPGSVAIGNRIKRLLYKRDISTQQFERDTGIARRIFYPRKAEINRSTLMAVAYYLGITVEDLVDGTDAFDCWYDR